MKILFLAQEPTLQRTEVVTGNAIRLDQLRTALLAAGHEVVHTWLADASHVAPGSFRGRDELQGLILAHAPDVVAGCRLACESARAGERILVFGSFLTVGPALEFIGPNSLGL